MTQIGRYLFRNLTVATVFVTAALSFAIWMTQSLRLVEMVVEGGAPLSFFLRLAVLTLPTFLGIVLPFALMAAVLFTYNRMIVDSELVVMRAAGLSPAKLAKPALLLAGLVTGIGFVLSLEIAPGANRELVNIRQEIRSEYSSVLLREGTYNDIGDGLTVYVRQRGEMGELSGLLIQDARKPERPVTIMAERGVLVTAEAGPRVIVFNGTQLEFHPDTGEIDTLDFARYTIDLKVLKQDGAGRWPDPRERSTGDLLFVGNDALDQQFAPRLKAELHNRLATPLFGIGFTMIALAALLSGEFSRRGQARRILAAVIGAIALEGLVLAMSNLISKNMALTPLLYLIVLAPIGGGYWYMRRWRVVRRLLGRTIPAAAE